MSLNKKIIPLGIILVAIYFIYFLDSNPKNISLLVNPNQITPVSPIYYVKLSREFLQNKFVFGNEDLSYWHFTIASKRINEARILKDHNLNTLAQKQLELAKNEQNQGFSRLKGLIDVIDTNNLQQLYKDNQEAINNFN